MFIEWIWKIETVLMINDCWLREMCEKYDNFFNDMYNSFNTLV